MLSLHSWGWFFYFLPDARTGTREDNTHTPTLSYICLWDILVLGKWVLEAVKLCRISKNMNTVGFIQHPSNWFLKSHFILIMKWEQTQSQHLKSNEQCTVSTSQGYALQPWDLPNPRPRSGSRPSLLSLPGCSGPSLLSDVNVLGCYLPSHVLGSFRDGCLSKSFSSGFQRAKQSLAFSLLNLENKDW